MNVVILVPRREGFADRDRLWAFARTWWANDFPDWRIVEGHHDDGPFNRSAAINTAAAAAGDWDVAVIIDADVLCDREAVKAAVEHAAATDVMVLAYHERVALSKQGTEKVIGGFRGNWRDRGMVKATFMDACSSAVVVSRKLWDTVAGFDERFVGWGYEDVAFRIACETLSSRPMVKIAATCWHLEHLVSPGNNQREATFQANRARADRYKAAHWDPVAVRALIDEDDLAVELGESTIPRILHRTVPAETPEMVEAWWERAAIAHRGWDLRTWRDPLDPAEFPETAPLWDRCGNGAQRAGLIRLEVLWRHGGVYIDSDVEVFRSFEPLVHCRGFAAWEDDNVVPDAVLGFQREHPAVRIMLDHAKAAVAAGEDAWRSGPGVTTAVLPGRDDVLVLPPAAFYDVHYTEKARLASPPSPYTFARHHWHGSWLTDEQRRKIARSQRR